MAFEDARLLAPLEVPEAHRQVRPARSELLAVRAEGHREHGARVARESRRTFLAAGGAPQPDRSVRAGRGEQRRGRAERHGGHWPGMAGQAQQARMTQLLKIMPLEV